MSSPKKVAKVVQEKPKENTSKANLSPDKSINHNSLQPVKTPGKASAAKPITPVNAPVIKELNEPSRLISNPNNKDLKGQSPAKEITPNKLQAARSVNSHEEIENKIKSRKRVLETLEEQSSSITNEMLLQLSSRDAIIEELNKELVLLKTKVRGQTKAVDKDSNPLGKNNSQVIADLESDKKQLESRIMILTDKHRSELQKLDEEKTQYELLQETMNEEIELLRAQLKAKEEEVESTIKDIKKLSEIVQQYKNLNLDLNQKIEKQNSDYEMMNIKFYESEVKTSSLIELENNLQDYIRIYQQSENRSNRLSEELRNMQILYDDLQAFCQYCEESLNESIEKLESDSIISKTLKKIQNGLSQKKKIQINEINENEKDKDKEIRELKEKLEQAYRDLKQYENSQSPLYQQVEGTMMLLQNLRVEHASSIENITKALKASQDYNESIKAEIANLRSENAKKEIKITNVTNKLTSTENKIVHTAEKIKKLKEANNGLEREAIEYKNKYSQLKNQSQEKISSIDALEKQNSKYVLNIQALHEEFWKKDTGLIKAKKMNLKLQKILKD